MKVFKMYNMEMVMGLILLLGLSLSCQSFIINNHPTIRIRTSKIFSSNGYSQILKRRNVKIPLLDIQGDDSIITPLPAAHLPDELATLQIYGMQLTAGIHKTMVTETVSKAQPLAPGEFFSSRQAPTYGHLVYKPDAESLVGAIGVAAEIVVATPSDALQIESVDSDSEPMVDLSGANESGEAPMTLLAKGSFRFVVKEITQTFPYPIAIVDELLDEEPVEDAPVEEEAEEDLPSSREYNDFEDKYEDEDEEEDDDDYDVYASIPSSDLVQRTMRAMKTIVDQKVNTKPKIVSPLEEAILKDSGMSVDNNMAQIQRDQAEELAAIFDIFVSDLLDIAPSRIERFYAVGMMAAEFAGIDNATRKKAVSMVDGVARLRMVLEEAERKISMAQAKKITKEIVEQSDEDSKDLQVGTPGLPPWAKQIRKGTEIEYFWAELEGWCKGKVIEDPVMVLDELIITILFEDGETHKLPFQGDEKARWRPSGMGE